MDMLKVHSAPDYTDLFLEVDQFAQSGAREVPNVAEVDHKSHAWPRRHQVNQTVERFWV